MDLETRSFLRRQRMIANRAKNFTEAEQWDLDFWQNQTPEERLSALVAIRRDVLAVEKARQCSDGHERMKDYLWILSLISRIC